MADLPFIEATVAGLKQMTTLQVIDGADHAFHVLARFGRTDTQAMDEILDAFVEWAGVAIVK